MTETFPHRSFSAAARRENVERLAQEEFDLLIIGGGITGVGIARDAAMRGFRTALVEKGDFGIGTSSRSTRLIHGGIRYLEYGEFKLVFDACSERRVLRRRVRNAASDNMAIEQTPAISPMLTSRSAMPGRTKRSTTTESAMSGTIAPRK